MWWLWTNNAKYVFFLTFQRWVWCFFSFKLSLLGLFGPWDFFFWWISSIAKFVEDLLTSNNKLLIYFRRRMLVWELRRVERWPQPCCKQHLVWPRLILLRVYSQELEQDERLTSAASWFALNSHMPLEQENLPALSLILVFKSVNLAS